MGSFWNILIRLTIVVTGLLSGEVASQSLKKIESYKVQNRADAFLKLDANRYVLAGQKNENWESLEKNKVTFRILDIPYRKTVDLSPPVAEFAANHPDVFIKATQSERFRTKDRSSNLILILFSLTGQRALRSRIRS